MAKTPENRMNLWTRLGATSVAGIAAASMTLAAQPEGSASGAPTADDNASVYLIAQGGEGGEGGEKAAAANSGEDDADFLTLLGLVEGHLRAGTELYRQGEADMAKTHMKHPSDELYADLEPALSARSIDGFAEPLEALAVAVESGKESEEADAAFKAVLEEIDDTRAAADADLSAKLKSIVNLVRTAADEYEIGVKDGRVTDPHEYQDAWGFVQAAKAAMDSLSDSERQRMGESFDKITSELTALEEAWPSVVPPETIATDSSLIYAGAARIELATLSVN